MSAEDVAAVLARLVEDAREARRAAWDAQDEVMARFWSAAGGWIKSVQRAQAATGARAAGGESAADIVNRLRAVSPQHQKSRDELPEHYAAPYALTPEPAYMPTSDPETLARRFHEAYERLAPSFGYETREASAKPWAQVPENNRRLMTAVCAEIAAAPPTPSAPGVAGDESAFQAPGDQLGHTGVDVLPGSKAGDSNYAAGDATC